MARRGRDEDYDSSGDEFEYGAPRLVAYRLKRVEERVKELEKKVDDLVKVLVGSVLTVAVMLAIYVMTSPGGQ